MNRITKGALIGSAAIMGSALALGVVQTGMSHSLIRIAFERELPFTPGIRTKKLFSGCRDIEKIEAFCCKGAKLLENGDCQVVSLTGRGGQRLVGHLHMCPEAERTIIAMHGWRTTWSRDFGTVSSFWHSHNCNVLYVEQRGQSNSGGRCIGFGITERYDCLDWIKWVNQNIKKPTLPIYLCGVSMGAATVLMAAGLDLPANVKGVIADCGFTSPHDIFKHVINKNLHFPYCTATKNKINRLCRKRLGFDPHCCSTIDALKCCRVPVMLVHGGSDRFVPVEMSYENFRACAAPKRLFIVPAADHGMCYYIDPEGYQCEMLRFFSDCEGGRGDALTFLLKKKSKQKKTILKQLTIFR